MGAIRVLRGPAFFNKGPYNLLLESKSHRGLGDKDYSKFTKIERSRARDELPTIFDARAGVLYQEMKRARETNILDYCAQHKIRTKVNENGETVLVGKDFVVLSPSSWKNTKNGTIGTIIDFVRIHEETTYLRAVAKINNNPRLLLLEPFMGEYKSSYQSFYIPKPRAASPSVAQKTLEAFLRSRGFKGDAAETLLKSERILVSEKRSIWLLGEKGDSGLEFREDTDGKWRGKRHGKPLGAFFEQATKSNRLVVYSDPFEFTHLKMTGFLPDHKGASVLVLDDSTSHRRVGELVALNSHITHVHFVRSERNEHGNKSLAQKMKTQLSPFDIHVEEVSISGLTMVRNTGRGPDIGI